MASPERAMTLREVCDDVSYGFTASATSEDTGVRLLRVTDIASGPVAWRSVPFCKIGPSEFQRHQLRESDIVLSRMGTVGVSAIVPPGVTAVPASYLVRFRANRAVVDPGYLFYVLNSPGWWRHVHARQTGAVQPNLNATLMGDFSFTPPSLSDQRRIAHILSTLDNKIELNRRMNGTLEEMARALFKSWFEDFEPVRAKTEGRDSGLPEHLADLFPNRLVKSELGEIPEGWTVGRLGDIADQVRRALRPAEIAPGTPYIGLEHMPRRSIALDTWGTADAVASGKSRFCEGEVLFGKLRPYFHKVGIASFDGVCSTDIVVLRAKQSEWAEFVLHLVSSDDFVAYTDARSAGTKMPRTSWSDMAQYRIARPTATVIERFAGIVGCLPARFALASHEARALVEIRNTLLRRLLDSHNSVGA